MHKGKFYIRIIIEFLDQTFIFHFSSLRNEMLCGYDVLLKL